MKVREGDMLKTFGSIVFDVKGLVHPLNRVVAFIRYIPDPNGNRERDGKRYSKYYSLSKRYDLLKREYPHYLVNDPVFNTLLCEVPVEDIKKHYQPTQGLEELRNRNRLDEPETAALRFMEILKERSGVEWNRLGVSGSILVKLQKPSSDIDLVVYGSKTGYKVVETMKEMFEKMENPIKAYDMANKLWRVINVELWLRQQNN